MADRVRLEIPAKPEYASVLRLTVAAVLNNLNASIEDIEDIRVAVSEALNKMFLGDTVQVEMMYVEKKIILKFIADRSIRLEQDDMGTLIMKSLMDSVEWEDNIIILEKEI